MEKILREVFSVGLRLYNENQLPSVERESLQAVSQLRVAEAGS
jgi:hypothetical protein